jgi:hypothetical protein
MSGSISTKPHDEHETEVAVNTRKSKSHRKQQTLAKHFINITIDISISSISIEVRRLNINRQNYLPGLLLLCNNSNRNLWLG